MPERAIARIYNNKNKYHYDGEGITLSLPFECINIVVQARSIESLCDPRLAARVSKAPEDYGYSWDEYLYRFGAMNDLDAALILSELEDMTLRGQVSSKGSKRWVDFCVFGDPATLRGCDWLIVDHQRGSMTHRDALSAGGHRQP